MLPPTSISGKSSVNRADETVALFCDWPCFQRAALALAIVSRRAADDVGAFESEDVGPADSEEVCEDIFEVEEKVRKVSIDSADRVEDAFFVPPAGLPPDLSLKFGSGLANAPWTGWRCLNGLAAKV